MRNKIQKRLSKINIGFFILILYSFSNATSFVKLSFFDTAEVTDTFFTVGDIAAISSTDSIIIKNVRESFAGKSAPPGYIRPVSVMDIVNYFLKNRFPEVKFTYNNKNFVYVKTANIETEICFFRKEIFDYIEKQIKWKDGDWKVDFINCNEKVSYLKKPFTIEIKGLDDPYPRGNKNITLIIKQKGYRRKVDVKCKFTVNTEVAVAIRDIQRGSIINKDDFIMKKTDITHLAQIPILEPALLENKQIICSIKPGVFIQKRMIMNIPDIEKGEEVSMVLKNNGILVSVPAISRERGSVGDYIWVENIITHKLIRAKVEKKGVVIVKKGGV
ncbi:MAG: flagellar basal body P-ring formation chaperone FlgA [Chitinispirillaceae bacterium]|nr:flagellar basal body P-ring formation chaperone FlgA [Chitinispirillaceae bacterium]